MTPDPTVSKAQWRRWVRTLPTPTADVSDAIAAVLTRFLADVDGVVLGYAPLPDEVDVTPALTVLGSRLALPRLGADAAMTLHLDVADRDHHTLGFAQPPAGAPAVAPADLAAVVVPGRAFDRRGFRLGRGGGHYDRLLPRLAAGVPVVGVVPADRVVGELPAEAHDRPMTHLATENGVTTVG